MLSSKQSVLAMFGLCFTLMIIVSHAALVPKNQAGPASEFSNFAIPDPKMVAQTSNSALTQIVFTQSKTSNNIEWITTIPVDTVQDFTLSIISNFTSELTLTAIPPKSSSFHSEHTKKPIVSNGMFGLDGNMIPSTSYLWSRAVVGEWTVKVSAPASLLANEHFARQVSGATPSAFLLALNPSEFQIYTYLQSYNNLFVGQQVPVLAMLTSTQETLPVGQRPAGYTPSAVKATNVAASINVIAPDGKSSTIQMHDDGLHSDGEANDGVYGAILNADEEGNYMTSVVFVGTSPNGDDLFRTTQHMIPVTSQYVTLSGNVQATQSSDELTLNFEVATIAANAPAVRLFAEVYGVDSAGEQVAIAWVQTVATAQKLNNQMVLQTTLNTRWIAAANATAPFSVANVLLSDMDTFVPINQVAELTAVKIQKYTDVRGLRYDPPLNVITKDMRDGKMPAKLAAKYGKVNTETGNGKLMLVHGYCANGNPFSTEDYTNWVAFEDPQENRPTNTFAQMVGEFGEAITDGFSIVGHSQGGLVALHLATYYHSNLDLSTTLPGRIIQSIGSPYQGTGLAGSLASIGSAIGIGCSANNDLTLDGAALWLSSIPTDKRELVYFTTTQYKTGGLVNYCNLAANSVLKWPNDGVTDTDHSSLAGATYANHLKGWCHTIDMKSPPQCTNKQNNIEFNQNSVW
ncbi:conditioned medium factor [Heterostelium album PN500]|uniref:Conditioned medium factor n=1 Tax=Heterostelium pallidum (strain ATCC 26659 / Pp 5 / PN500) TaxID=670386 RepID=D3BMF5_HETP5|nr:conditioned medium factor [Heterostelium album PN500]EFA77167.1 conditioned medium factor [Heterostelium album PN500]|eukprot:XP_020429296.1 conditioned medium factor [Heterostelium album PN500]